MSKSILTVVVGSGLLGTATSLVNNSATGPIWGCGLLGDLPGIKSDGSTSSELQKMIDGLKGSSDFDMVSYWNWDLAPMDAGQGMQYLSKDFLFMPDQWGVEPVRDQYVREAGKANFLDAEGKMCPATMATIFLGANEPDITGSCMGNMMGTCTGSCTGAEVASGCPVAHFNSNTPAAPLPNGHCDCWSDSYATGVGFWPVAGCSDIQPLPNLWKDNDAACIANVIDMWRQTAATVTKKGYKYLTTPLIAADMDYMNSFVRAACDGCNDVSCGCPSHVGWHFYANDCRPITLGGYDDFQMKLDKTRALMEEFPHLQGAIVNEVGMLNCNMDGPEGACIPNGPTQKFPAINQPNHDCPINDELPNGLASFVEELVKRAVAAKTSDGRPVVASFSWFNLNMAGGTYNLQLFNEDGSLNSLGEAYISACSKWSH